MLNHGSHAPCAQPGNHRLAEFRNDIRVHAKRTVPDDVMCPFDRHIQQRQTIDIDAELNKFFGNKARINAGGLAGQCAIVFGDAGKQILRRSIFPMRRA